MYWGLYTYKRVTFALFEIDFVYYWICIVQVSSKMRHMAHLAVLYAQYYQLFYSRINFFSSSNLPRLTSFTSSSSALL